MQWHDASVGGGTLTAWQEPDVSQVVEQFGTASAVPALPGGLELPCSEDPELFFAESPSDVEQAKAMCRGCRARLACLTGALSAGSPGGSGAGNCSCVARSCRASGRVDVRASQRAQK